jgi:hypothetical protein
MKGKVCLDLMQASLTITNTNFMTERSFILSTQKNALQSTAGVHKSIIGRIVGFFTERFDAVASFVSKWTNV